VRREPFARGLGEVLAAFRDLSPEMADAAAEVVESRRLSAPGSWPPGGLGRCISLVQFTAPWVYAPYAGRIEGVFTLARELGHAVRSRLAYTRVAMELQSDLRPMSEAAAVLAEAIVARRMLSRASGPFRTAFLAGYLDHILRRLCHFTFHTLFEEEARLIAVEGGPPEVRVSLLFAPARAGRGIRGSAPRGPLGLPQGKMVL
jgi:oligoendopeptidase F